MEVIKQEIIFTQLQLIRREENVEKFEGAEN